MILKNFMFFALVIFLIGFVGAQVGGSFAQSVTYQPRASFQAIYGAEGRLETYWPILGDKETCQARQDLLLQVSPAGCQPAVVRSDLLAEQNVPVFCQIDALQINPLIDIEKVRGIRFSRKYPDEIAGAGFHPAKAALRSRDKLLGSPLINNIGYVVVVLKKNPVEKNLPEFVKVNLTAQIDYEADNAFGIGKSEFLLSPMSDYEWDNNKFKQSFWNGRYSVRLENADPNSAVVSIFSGDRKIATTKVNRGQNSGVIYVPGAYCRAGVSVAYDGFVAAENMARIQISDDESSDVVDLYTGSRFLNDRCSVEKIVLGKNSSAEDVVRSGTVSIRCSEGQRLELKVGELIDKGSINRLYLSEEYDKNKGILVYTDSERKSRAGLYLFNEIVYAFRAEGEIIGGIDNNGLINLNKEKFDKAVKAPDNLQISDFVKKSFDLINGAKINGREITLNSMKSSKDEATSETDKKFNEAIDALVKVNNEYPAEVQRNAEGSMKWGEIALIRAIELSSTAGKEKIKEDLLRKFIESYPDSAFYEQFRYDLRKIGYNIDLSEGGGVVNIDDRFYNVRFLELIEPKKQSSADFSISGVLTSESRLELNELKNLSDQGVGSIDSMRFDKIDSSDQVSISVNCRAEKNANGQYNLKSVSQKLRLNEEALKICDKAHIRLRNVEIEEIARVRLLPHAQGTRTETNLTVNIGIEKRAIKLSPEKTEELIENLNTSIEKWENINEKLGKVVTGLKGACFATAGVLTVKNFLTGIGGEALARQKVMVGWTRECGDLVNSGKYPTLNACYLAKSDEIDKDVNSANSIINQINSKIESIEKNNIESSSFGVDNINRAKAAVAYCNDLKARYGGREVVVKAEKKKIEQLLGDCEQGYNNQGLYGYNELRELEYNLVMKDSAVSDGIKKDSDIKLKSSYDQIADNRVRFEDIEKAKLAVSQGLPSPIVATSSIQKNVVGEVVPVSGVKIDNLKSSIGNVQYISRINVYSTLVTKAGDGSDIKGFEGGNYVLGLEKNSEGYYDVSKIIKENKDGTYTALDEKEASGFGGAYGIGRITSAESVSYVNPYKNPEIRYYETEPYKGMPAIVPFDVKEGWYAATRQTLPAFGGIGAFDASGRVTSFYLCNIGPNGNEQFFEGYGDDICQLINLNTGQPLGFFPGLSETEAKRRVGQAVQAIQDASNQYGKGKTVLINGRRLGVGRPAANIPSTQCQNFMSPEECHLLFNVCDPVICPSSRCDFGGQYPVADVVQTGIIGSTLLCLPNIREKIVIPVCLTGIHAGIEGFVSILKNHRDCLQESLETGQTIGICDQIYSVYLCEFFWRQIAPVAKIILPKIVEFAYGQGSRGGGEYLTVGAAWQNMQDSVNYFTQSYAVNSINSFKARNIEEAGAPFCKAFVSAKAPTSFKTLIEPDSPPQFNAWFSATRFSDATLPATSQYKVFYHIFAGKDQGVYYSVYLKNPPESGFYAIPAVVHVASGFVGKGQYATESRDFTAPEGYKELCVRVNDQEECGFKEVSTSFAVNYLRDQYVSDQAKEGEIKSEKECVSGSPNLGAAVLGPNIQAGAEETGLPQIYGRGIVRICSSRNPGNQIDPTRFVDKGYCDDQKIRCWLDKESVKNAITDNNKGVFDATLSDIEKSQNADLAKKGIIVGDDVAVAEIKILKDEVDRFNGITVGFDEVKTKEILARLDALFGRVVYNHHKANILYMIGDLKASVAERLIQIKLVEIGRSAVVGQSDKIADSIGVGNAADRNGMSLNEKAEYVLSKEYNQNDDLYIVETKGNISRNIIDISSGLLYIKIKEKSAFIGNIIKNGNNLKINLKDSLNIRSFGDYLKGSEINITEADIEFYYRFKDATIQDNKITFAF